MARARTALQAIGGGVQTTTQQKDYAKKQEQAYTQYFRRYELMIEFINLRNPHHCPRGIYVMPSSDNIDVWYGTVFVHKGYYADAVFKFRITVPEFYPVAAPIVHFLSDIYHPLVDTDRQLDLSPRFPEWKPKRDYIFHVLQYMSAIFRRRTLDSLDEEACPNKEAIHLYKHDPHVFSKLAQQCAGLSVQDNVVYDNYPENNCIRFTRMSDKKFEEIKKYIFESHEEGGEIDMEKVLSNFKQLTTNINKLTEK
jgi:ubiquitin-protein ligase